MASMTIVSPNRWLSAAKTAWGFPRARVLGYRTTIRTALYRMMFRWLWQKLREWNALQSVEAERKRLLQRKFLSLEATYLIIRGVSMSSLFIFLLIFDLSALNIWEILGNSMKIGGMPLSENSFAWNGTFLILLFLLFLLISFINFFDKPYMRVILLWLFGVLPLLVAIASTVFAVYEDNSTGVGAGAVYFSFGISTISIYVLTGSVILLVNFLYSVVQASLEARFPEAAIVHRIFVTTSRLDRQGASWLSVGERSAAIREIDRAASIIRVSLFRRFRTGDHNIRAWRDERALRVSHALREKEQWLITPKEDTRGCLTERLSTLLVTVLAGNWDHLEASEGDIAFTPPVHRRVLRLAAGVVVGFLPAAIYGAGRYFKWFSLGSPIDDYIQGGLVLWGIVTLISGFDPLLKEKLSAVKDLIGLFRGGKKE